MASSNANSNTYFGHGSHLRNRFSQSAQGNHLSDIVEQNFNLYESVRGFLPKLFFYNTPMRLDSLIDILDVADGFFLDAFGVLNLGDHPIKEAYYLIDGLRERKKPFFILTNSASYPKSVVMKNFSSLGFDFSENEVITSREVLWRSISMEELSFGVIAPTPQTIEIEAKFSFLGDDGFFESDGFIFLSTLKWDETLQSKLKTSMQKRPRVLYVANPDVVAPRGNGLFSKEPGFYTLLEENSLFSSSKFIGKPFGEIFEYAIKRAELEWGVERGSIAMVGDTLHTDILGGKSSGLKTVLLERYGFFCGVDSTIYIEKSGIAPDFIV